MLAFISDLHLSDETAIAGNVAPEAFALALAEIQGLAEQIARARDEPVTVTLVLLGDIFDLLRTERWFEDREGNAVPLAERPWATAAALSPRGTNPLALAHARSMVSEIVEKNAEALATLRGERVPAPEGVSVRRVYVPGNHDRLYLHDEALAGAMRAALGATDGALLGEEGFGLHAIELPGHGLIARHGHEWDAWNFPAYRGPDVLARFPDVDYLPTPIGDAVTTEMAARLPYELEQRLLESRVFSRGQARRVHDVMKRIDDVRPLFASFRWAHYAAERIGADLVDRTAERQLRIALDDSLRAMARAFRELPFYEAWQEVRHEPCRPDQAALLRALLWAMSTLGGSPLRVVAELVERVIRRFNPIDAARRGAAREDLARVGREEMRFVVYGHTHVAAQLALRGSAITQDVYLNTGTYRPGVFRSETEGFVGWNRLGYVCVLSEDEASSTPPVFGLTQGGPGFVAWSGARSHGSPSLAGRVTVRAALR
jgi:UDP-2,3-diacylglucosamine pyrophosphatase LpxH